MSKYVLLEQCFNGQDRLVENYVYKIDEPFKRGDLVKGSNYIGRILKEVVPNSTITYKNTNVCSKQDIKNLEDYPKEIIEYLCKRTSKVMTNKQIIEKAYKKGFYVWDKENRCAYKEHAYGRSDTTLIVDGRGIGDWDVEEDLNEYYPIIEYGDVWALTEEELYENHRMITKDGRELSEKQLNVLGKGSSKSWLEKFVRGHSYKECSERIGNILKQWEEEREAYYRDPDMWSPEEQVMEDWLQSEYCGG